LARRLGKEGKVLLKLLIDTDGKLQKIEVVEPAGFGFTEAAVEAVKKSTYAPGYRNGERILTKALLPVRFQLQ
jgi:protein TonB